MKRMPWLVTWLLVLGAMPAAPAPADTFAFPGTPAGAAAEAWFQAFNGTEADMRELYAKHYAPGPRTPEQRLAVWKQLRSDLTSLTPVRVAEERPGHIEVIARDGHAGFARLSFELDPGGLIVGVSIDQADASEAAAPPPADTRPLSETGVVALLSQRVDSLAAAGQFSGVVRLEHHGTLLLERAWGEANRDTHTPNRVDTRFNIGSLNKQFTKAVIAKLCEQGKLKPDDKLSKFLPDFPRNQADKITIQQLLDMRSGLGDFFGPRYMQADKSKLRNPRDWFPLFVGDSLQFEPGTSERYSNAGYVVLGAVIEAITGKSYYDVVRDWVYKPAGMKNTDSYAKDDASAAVAIGYSRRLGAPGDPPGDPRPNTAALPWRGSPAGGGYSTAQDLSRYVHALEGQQLLSEQTLSRFYGAVRLPNNGGLRVALGVAGGSPGCNADVENEWGWTLVVLANGDPPAAESLARTARDWIRRVPDPSQFPQNVHGDVK